MDFLKAWLAQHPEFRQLVDFYQENLTLVDFIIVIFGSFLLFFKPLYSSLMGNVPTFVKPKNDRSILKNK